MNIYKQLFSFLFITTLSCVIVLSMQNTIDVEDTDEVAIFCKSLNYAAKFNNLTDLDDIIAQAKLRLTHAQLVDSVTSKANKALYLSAENIVNITETNPNEKIEECHKVFSRLIEMAKSILDKNTQSNEFAQFLNNCEDDKSLLSTTIRSFEEFNTKINDHVFFNTDKKSTYKTFPLFNMLLDDIDERLTESSQILPLLNNQNDNPLVWLLILNDDQSLSNLIKLARKKLTQQDFIKFIEAPFTDAGQELIDRMLTLDELRINMCTILTKYLKPEEQEQIITQEKMDKETQKVLEHTLKYKKNADRNSNYQYFNGTAYSEEFIKFAEENNLISLNQAITDIRNLIEKQKQKNPNAKRLIMSYSQVINNYDINGKSALFYALVNNNPDMIKNITNEFDYLISEKALSKETYLSYLKNTLHNAAIKTEGIDDNPTIKLNIEYDEQELNKYTYINEITTIYNQIKNEIMEKMSPEEQQKYREKENKTKQEQQQYQKQEQEKKESEAEIRKWINELDQKEKEINEKYLGYYIRNDNIEIVKNILYLASKDNRLASLLMTKDEIYGFFLILAIKLQKIDIVKSIIYMAKQYLNHKDFTQFMTLGNPIKTAIITDNVELTKFIIDIFKFNIGNDIFNVLMNHHDEKNKSPFNYAHSLAMENLLKPTINPFKLGTRIVGNFFKSKKE